MMFPIIFLLLVCLLFRLDALLPSPAISLILFDAYDM